MKTIGNLLWILFGGFFLFLGWMLAGVVWCVTVIGVPVGLQCFKFAFFALWPFGKTIVPSASPGKFLLNLIWIVFFGWELALVSAVTGLLWCVTVVGIPFGLQFFKLASLSLLPFGSKIV